MNRLFRCLAGNDGGNAPSVKSISFQKIVDGTNQFALSHRIGRGSFGKVYRCELRKKNRTLVVAAKVQDIDNPDGEHEFEAEITALHAADHENIIKLVGKCDDDITPRTIVYEFMPQGSVDNHLHPNLSEGPSQRPEPPVLDWTTRMKIAVGVAEGLVHIHDRLKIIHRDIKAANVLLDKDYNPKLADFGLSLRVVEDENNLEKESKVSPDHGTPGCIAPETKGVGLVSTKSDVYSYGVLLLHLFTGKKPYDAQRPSGSKNLAEWFKRREQYEQEIVDVALGNRYSVQGLKEIMSTVTMCLNAHPPGRPHMHYVLTLVRRAAAYPVQVNSSVTERRSDAHLESYDRLECLPDRLVKASTF